MRRSLAQTIALAALLPLAGCMSEDVLRYDGVTTSAGNAIAANSVLQMVDPWPRGVEDTNLRTPADLDQYRDGQADQGVSYDSSAPVN